MSRDEVVTVQDIGYWFIEQVAAKSEEQIRRVIEIFLEGIAKHDMPQDAIDYIVRLAEEIIKIKAEKRA